MFDNIKQKIIDKLIENPDLLKVIDDKWLSPEMCVEVMHCSNYKGFEFMPEKYKTQDMYKEWMEATNYRFFKDVPDKFITEEMSDAAYKANRQNINYFPIEYLDTKKILDSIDFLSEESIRQILDPTFKLDKIVPREIRLNLLVENPHLMAYCEFDLIKDYYKMKAKDLSPSELKRFQKKLLYDCPKPYIKYLEAFFNGEEKEPKEELFHTNKGSITADEMVDLITSGIKVDVLDNFDEKSLNIIGTYFRKNENAVLYQYNGDNFLYTTNQAGEFVEKLDDISNQPTPNINTSEIDIYTLVKNAELAIVKDKINLIRMDYEKDVTAIFQYDGKTYQYSCFKLGGEEIRTISSKNLADIESNVCLLNLLDVYKMKERITKMIIEQNISKEDIEIPKDER